VIARVVTINQLTYLLKVLVEDDEDLQDLWVDGEISNLTIARSGHAYFTLRDETCQLSAVMWRTALARQQMIPREGDRVIAHGCVTFYQPRGNLQLSVDVLQPQGTGILQLRLEELRQRLEAEGMFEPSRKRPLPVFPLRIGIVTSGSGAVWHDIQQVISRRFPLAELILSPAIVQGEQAPESLVDALSWLQETAEPDVIIIGRGGGSLEDLWAFNDERVVRAIYACRVPIISAVGHETDTTLADYVADMRAPTPSVAAELAVPDIEAIDEGLREIRRRMSRLLERRLEESLQLLDDMQGRLTRVSPAAQLRTLLHELEPLEQRLHSAVKHKHELAHRDVDAFAEILEALNPQALMGRGFGFMCNADTGQAIRSIKQVAPGTSVRAVLADGEFLAGITEATPNSRPAD
jgi:exodeoxyribonuclease VII large subunit